MSKHPMCAGICLLTVGFQVAMFSDSQSVYWAVNFYTRILEGELYRLLTSPFIHLDLRHWVLDVPIFCFLWLLLRRSFSEVGVLMICMVSLVCGQLFTLAWFLMGELERCGDASIGLSNAIHGFTIILCFLWYRQSRRLQVVSIVVSLIVLSEILFACLYGHMPGFDMLQTPGMNHLGGIAGAIAVYWLWPQTEVGNGHTSLISMGGPSDPAKASRDLTTREVQC